MNQSAAEAMKEKLSKSQSYSQTSRYWDEGRVLKVGFLLVFVRAFARIILKTFGLFTPVVSFLIMIILGGALLSAVNTSDNLENLESFENSAREKTEKITPVKNHE